MSAIAAWEGLAPREITSMHRPALTIVPTPLAIARSTGDAGLRPTRAGRLLATVVVALILVSIWMAVFTPRAASASASSPLRTVTVQAGQTLSELAVRHLPQLAPAEGVARIQLANRMSGTHVLAGQHLVIPDVP